MADPRNSLLHRQVVLHDPPIRGQIVEDLGKMRFIVEAMGKRIECHRADFKLPPLMEGWTRKLSGWTRP
jgi:hypothetical protein